MKVIKLRAWDPYDNKWAHFTIGESFGSWQEHVYKSLCLEGVEFYMFTGLLDKNGKEIYEGDIVNLHPDENDKIWHRQIVWDTAAFHCKQIHGDANHLLHFHKHMPNAEWVVIGNVHENPDLL